MAERGELKLPIVEGISEERRARWIALRRELHRHPELALEEHETCKRLHRALEALVPARLDRVAGTGLVARFAGEDREAPVVAVRGDIDALPVTEETGAPFASEVPGRMHACGHDVHAAWTVAAASLLAERPAAGDVLIVLQPAEEVALGAEAVLASGALDGVAAIFGAHVDLRLPLGQAVAQEGPLAASADTFRLHLAGGGAHGARPHEGVDPIVGGAAVVGALQTIVSRRVPPGTPAVVSLGTFEAGTAPNVIPASARLSGTVRAMDEEVRSLLHREVERIAREVGGAHGLKVAVEIVQGTPPLVNTPREAAWARRAAERLLGPDGVRPLGMLNMAGEDFAAYLERIPGCFLRVGGRRPEEPAVPAHSPRFLPADESVVVGAVLLAETAREASAALRDEGRRT